MVIFDAQNYLMAGWQFMTLVTLLLNKR